MHWATPKGNSKPSCTALERMTAYQLFQPKRSKGIVNDIKINVCFLMEISWNFFARCRWRAHCKCFTHPKEDNPKVLHIFLIIQPFDNYRNGHAGWWQYLPMTGKSPIRFKICRTGYTGFSWPTTYLLSSQHQSPRLGKAIAESFAALVKQGSSFTFGDGQPGSPQPGVAGDG